MPTITLNKDVFEKLIGKKFSPEKLKDRISMLGTDLESIENNEINVEIFPNRPDLLSEQGFARAFASFTGLKTGLKKYEIKKSGKQVIVDSSVTMRPYTACAIVKNIKFDDEKIREIMQIQEKLATTHGRNRKKSAYGIYPLKNINFPINYIAKDPKKVEFHPLGMEKPIRADTIEELHPKGIEYKEIAKGWKKYPFFIDNNKNIMCMLPYTNSNDTGKVDESTNEVFIECTGIDFRNVSIALNIFVTMFADMGGKIYSVDIKYPDKTIVTPNLEPKKMDIDLKYVNKILGLELQKKDLKECLEKMGFGYEKEKALIPAFRADILHQIDLIEDIAIAYGYENFEEQIPNVATIGEESSFEIYKEKISEILIGLGILETSSYNLMDVKTQTSMMMVDNIKPVRILDPVSLEYNSLRGWMIPIMMEILKKNKSYEYPQSIFEIGHVFKYDEKSETGTTEAERLCVAIAQQDADFTKIKQIFDYLMTALDLKYESVETDHISFIEGRVARIIVNDEKVAYIGEIHPKVLENFEMEIPVCLFELNLSDLFKVTIKK